MQCGGVSVSVLQRAPLSSLLEAVHQCTPLSMVCAPGPTTYLLFIISPSPALLEIETKIPEYHMFSRSLQVSLVLYPTTSSFMLFYFYLEKEGEIQF